VIILGLTATISWNTAAALVQDGRLVAAAEQERFNRIKQAPRIPPVEAAEFCLQSAGIDPADVDCIAVGFASPMRYALLRGLGTARSLAGHDFLLTAPSVAEYMIQQYKLRQRLFDAMPALASKKWVYVPHHVAHAASAYRASGFDETGVLVTDGNGERDSTQTGFAQNGKLTVLDSKAADQSLGGLYSNTTSLLGFSRHIDEGKTMGLAAYGTPKFPLEALRVHDGTYTMPRSYIRNGFWKDFPFQRHPGDEITQEHKDFAASVQHRLEEAGIALAQGIHNRTGSRRLALAGGVVLNCDMNAKILQQDFVDDIYIQPAAHDAGTAIGAALEVAAQLGEPGGFVMDHAYWGPEYSAAEIQATLDETKVPYEKPRDIEQATADLLSKGLILGWFQGRMEIGPRALGGRSILANPGMAEMKDRVNAEVKHREGWRPFAPSMLAESADDMVENSYPSPFMLLTFTVRKEWRERLAAATHIDHTVRSQTVTRDTNSRFYSMIEKFRDLTGIPAVMNTSFNDRGEPIVMSPRDALRTFFSTGLDALAIGDFVVRKKTPAPDE
jgi:carbamoyltransferase